MEHDSMNDSLVQIVGPTDSWVLEKQARQLASKLPYARFCDWKPQVHKSTKLVYYVNYALFQRKSQYIDVGFFTHFDEESQFLERAKEMDHAVCMSKIYADWLTERGVKTVTHIPVGFDYYRYRARLIIGVVGLTQHPRKGKHLVDRVNALDFVELRMTEGQLTEKQLIEFYRSLDFVLIPATVEGGPMSLLESLASGTPVIAPSGVGLVPEFSDTRLIRRYPTGDVDALIKLLYDCYQEKSAGQQLVANRTLDRWAALHHNLFRNLLFERGIRFPEPAEGFRFGMMGELEISPLHDSEPIEQIVDGAAKHFYFGDYARVKAVLREGAKEYPCLLKLERLIPQADELNLLSRADSIHTHQKPVSGSKPIIASNDLVERDPNVLVIAHVSTLRERMDKSHYLRYKALSQRPGFTLFGPGVPGYRDGMPLDEVIDLVCGGQYPDIIIHGGDLRDSGVPLVKGIDQARCPTAIELLDTWANPDRTFSFIRNMRFKIGLMQEGGFHLQFFQQQCPETKFFWTPNSVDTELFRDYGLPKIYDIIFYGVVEPNIYPFRARLLRLLTSDIGLKVKVIEHPGYYPRSGQEGIPVVAGSNLSKEINQAWIGIATRSIYNCLLMKYLEIPASGAAIAGNIPDSGRNLLAGCIIELTEEMSDEDIISTLKDYLKDKNRLRRMATVSSHRVSRDFSTHAFADRVIEICRQFLGDRRGRYRDC